MSIDSSLLEILACPECKGPLGHQDKPAALTCKRCRLAYPVTEEGVPLLIADEALPYRPDDGDRPQ